MRNFYRRIQTSQTESKEFYKAPNDDIGMHYKNARLEMVEKVLANEILKTLNTATEVGKKAEVRVLRLNGSDNTRDIF